jgi:hypothetical protein
LPVCKTAAFYPVVLTPPFDNFKFPIKSWSYELIGACRILAHQLQNMGMGAMPLHK